MTEELIDKLLKVRSAVPFEVKEGKTALLIIDMQEYQVRKDWAAYNSLNAIVPGLMDYYVDRVASVAEPNMKRLVEYFRRRKMKVVFTMYSSFERDGADLPRQIRTLNDVGRKKFGGPIFPHFDHPGSKIIESLQPQEDDLVIVKNTSNVFLSSGLDFFLKNMGIERLVVAGVVTNMCVEGAARSGFELGYDVAVVDDACAAWSPETHRHSLRSFGMLFGSVANTDDIIGQ